MQHSVPAPSSWCSWSSWYRCWGSADGSSDGTWDIIAQLATEDFELDLSAGVGDLSAEGKVFGVLIGAEAEAEATLHIEHSSSISTTRESETEISFSLGDPDDGDEIVVEIFHDPVFGSFVFNTISGRTRCRHEPNTVKSEGKFLFVFSCILI